jgi:hypothetical protein
VQRVGAEVDAEAKEMHRPAERPKRLEFSG